MAEADVARSPLRVLYVEDSALDAELVAESLRDGGYDLDMQVAPDGAAYERLLADGPYDVILADYNLPAFDAHAALEMAKAVCPATPFICVSGTIGEETTVELLKEGADDVVLKDRVARLAFAVRRAIADKAGRVALVESERRFRALFENLLNGYAFCRLVYDGQGRAVDCIYVDVNPAFERLTGLKDAEGSPLSKVLPDLVQGTPQVLELCARVAETGVPERAEILFAPYGMWLAISVYSTEPGTFITVFDNVTERRQALEDLVANAERLQRTIDGAIEAMGSMVAARDPYTAGHERRVTELCMAIARDLELDDHTATGLRLAGLVHDIGKLTVPAEILTKPSKLSELEFELIKVHSAAGHEILGSIEFEHPVAEIVHQHHERLDGSGYPRGLTGDAILEQARILAVADVVEAMASHRPYRVALGVEAALEEVRSGAGVRYDARAVAACERAFAGGFEFSEA